MSLAAVVSRVQELEALVRPPARVSPTAFASQLASAQSVAGLASVQSASAPVAGGATPYDAEISAAAARHGVDPALLKGLIRQESGFDPNAGSPAGARGLAQLMPGTAAALGVTDPTDPAQAIEGGAKYLRQQLDAFGGDVSKALAAYNAGPGAVTRYGGVPPYAETQEYVRKVQAFAAGYRSAPAATPSALSASTT
jgi:soluble lytic murein transglycosylase-like protein